ncbi:MAG TPA: hypothetical protein VMR08_02855 [Patescibacteria group bacterium]|jgi:ABC-type phosphate transport system permease subunit|nr:hypothetical protein [Patescibacteria group bacterium]
MTPTLLFGLIVIAPILLVFLLRVNAAVLFMSLCVGEVLVIFLSNDAGTLSGVVSPATAPISQASLKLALLFIPPLLTLIFRFHSIKGLVKSLLNLIPSIFIGLVGALMVEPLLSTSYQKTLNRSALWHNLTQAQALIVGCGAIVCLVFFLFQRHSFPRRKKHGHSHEPR